ncbi:MAG: dTDP-4-keto-6-deoxy-D-glucose epimerase [Chlorobiota bacterium]|nr:MAG: dTDP-4-keto-6-deoxy-D-glucose epimerase [Chlorobiota bacterium]
MSALGLPTSFVQDNVSTSHRGVIRGMHFQWDPPLGKLLSVLYGRIQLVELDIRPDSPHCGKHWTCELCADEPRLVWIPPGFANGFLVLSDSAVVHYKCTAPYNPSAEGSIRWNDPALAIPWTLDEFTEPITSDRDARGMTLKEWLSHPAAHSFSYHQRQ